MVDRFEDSWFMVQSSSFMIFWVSIYCLWFTVDGLRVVVYGVWFMDDGTWYLISGLWLMVHACWFLVYGLWCTNNENGSRVVGAKLPRV